MSENQKKPVSFFKKFAGLFYRFDDEQPKIRITDREKLTNNLPVTAEKKQPPDNQKPVHSPVQPEVKQDQPGNETPNSKPIKAEEKLPEFVFPESNNISAVPDEKDNKQASGRIEDQSDILEPGKYPPIVSFKNVYKIFNQGSPNEFMALKDVNFEIEDLPDVGEFIALVGPSGCGKSTVLNLIQGFQEVGPPSSGQVLVRNKPVFGPGRDRGMIFQKYSSFPHLTVLQNVMFGLQLNRETLGYSNKVMENISREMIAKVGMRGHEDKYPYQLSGGQQQRVAIARTLVLKPRIILMDEPFSALDEPTRIEMQQLITSLWKEVEATVFIVTHSLAEAVYLSDRIFMFKSNPGRLTKQIMVKAEDIGKYEGMNPVEVQESSKFNQYLKNITDEFMLNGGSD